MSMNVYDILVLVLVLVSVAVIPQAVVAIDFPSLFWSD
jgi:hypothetical protein